MAGHSKVEGHIYKLNVVIIKAYKKLSAADRICVASSSSIDQQSNTMTHTQCLLQVCKKVKKNKSK